MRKPQSKLIAAAFLLLSVNSKAQFRLPVTNNDLRTNLSKILTDYAKGFTSLKGDTIDINPQTVVYTSRLDFKEAEHNSIVEYRSSGHSIYSWQALLLTTEDFEEASKKYKWLYNQLKVMTVKVEDYSFTLDGAFQIPDESRNFSSSIFKLTPNAANMPRLKIEASMQFEFPEWKVSLMVYEKEREDFEGDTGE